MRSIVAAAAVILPLAAFAQTSSDREVPPVADVPAVSPSWSIGAGVSFGTPMFVSTLTLGLSVPDAQVPGAAASIERRVSPRSWLVLGVDGAAGRERRDLDPGLPGVTRSDTRVLSVVAGLRYVLTSPGAPVDVSALAFADAGVARQSGDGVFWDSVSSGYVDGSFSSSAWRVGASVGLAVDRELTRTISLRVSTPLVGASYAKTRTTVTSRPTQHGDDYSVRAVLAPSLALRVAF